MPLATEKRFEDFALRLRESDNVAVAKRALSAGMALNGSISIVTDREIPAGHKVAVSEIGEGEAILKYGQLIGYARKRIGPGEHVHTHNVRMREDADERTRMGHELCADFREVEKYPAERMRHFPGYARPDGRVGTRNYVGVISSVNCSASVSRYVTDRFRGAEFARDFPNVDGVIPFTHKGGCAIQLGQPHEVLKRVLAGVAKHPNVFGYVMIGLGCETNQVSFIRSDYGLDVIRANESRPTFINIQEAGGVRKTVDAAAEAVLKLCGRANEARRTRQEISKLILALNCGGSDGNSGITANPALGVASDELVRFGGTSVLAETPEIYGAEHLLLRRAATREVAEKLLRQLRWWEEHVKLFGASIDNNPTYGNKQGGLTTIYEKSLGAVAKGGQSPLMAVYDYAEKITSSGFSFMDTPGYDPVSMTGLVCGGCNIGCFTTGRGSVYGCKPAPCIKIATNTAMYERMTDDMDINAGTILDGMETLEQVGMRIFEKIVAVAGGEKTKSEAAGIGDEEFAPWMLGPTF
jgi:altronate dehydratase